LRFRVAVVLVSFVLAAQSKQGTSHEEHCGVQKYAKGQQQIQIPNVSRFQSKHSVVNNLVCV